ncbi:complex I subunit 4 family protein, partial [Methylogaea oryzae]
LAERLGGGWLNYHLGVDGVSLLFVLLTAGLGFLALLYGRDGSTPPPRSYSAAVLAYQAVLVGLFASQDIWLFAWLSAAETGLALWLLWRWRAGVSGPAMTHASQFLGGALILLLAAAVLLGWQHAESAGRWSFDLADLLEHPAPANLQTAAFFLLLFAFGIRLPLFPLHGWLAPAVQHAGPLAVAPVFLAGLKTGIYGLVRWVLPILPDAVRHWDLYLVPLAVLGIFYGAVLALVQQHLGRLLAYAVVSHASALTLGVLTLDKEGLAGTLLMSIDAGIASAGLLFACGMIHRRTGTVFLPRLGDLFDPLPALGLAFMIAALTLMGMPGTPGFDAAHLLLEGTLEVHEWGVAVALASGNVLTAAMLLWAFQRVFLAQRRGTRRHGCQAMTLPELIVAGALSAALLAGFYTHPWLSLIEPALPGPLQHYAQPH